MTIKRVGRVGYEVVVGWDIIDIVANGKKVRDFMDSFQDYYICNRKMCGKTCFEQCNVTTSVEYALKDADGNPVRAKFGNDGEPYVIMMPTEK